MNGLCATQALGSLQPNPPANLAGIGRGTLALRKLTVLLLTLACILAFQVGSASANSKLNEAYDGLIGIRYEYGGTTTSGFDCSGFTSYVFRKLGVELPRTSKDQFAIGQKVDQANLLEGDLVFFNTSGRGVSHVGIYIGDGNFVHASTSRGVVISGLSDKYYVKRYMGARRVLDDHTYLAVTTSPQEEDETSVLGSAEPEQA